MATIRDIGPIDLALIELVRNGTTEAPPQVLGQLQAKGYLTLASGKPKLTASGRTRAEALKPHEGNLRTMAANTAAGRMPITTAANGSLRT
jgi:hypothetical protein